MHIIASVEEWQIVGACLDILNNFILKNKSIFLINKTIILQIMLHGALIAVVDNHTLIF